VLRQLLELARAPTGRQRTQRERNEAWRTLGDLQRQIGPEK
jgi:hypothetical protein